MNMSIQFLKLIYMPTNTCYFVSLLVNFITVKLDDVRRDNDWSYTFKIQVHFG